MLFVIFGVPVGALVALQRYPVFSLAPVVALFAAGAIVTGIAFEVPRGLPPEMAALVRKLPV
jgi:hypothetical protein